MARLLIIEDEPRLASFVGRALRAAGFGVDASDDGRSGLGMALTGIYALVILDLTLPSLSGEGVLCEVLANRRFLSAPLSDWAITALVSKPTEAADPLELSIGGELDRIAPGLTR